MTDEYQIDNVTWAEKDSNGNIVINVEDAAIKDRPTKYRIRKSSGGTVYAVAQRDDLTDTSAGSFDAAMQHALDEINGNGGRIEVAIDPDQGATVNSTIDLSGKASSLTVEFETYKVPVSLADNVDANM
jgi:flavin-binding protein dodecin